jgi:hypothetical protein
MLRNGALKSLSPPPFQKASVAALFNNHVMQLCILTNHCVLGVLRGSQYQSGHCGPVQYGQSVSFLPTPEVSLGPIASRSTALSRSFIILLLHW